VAVAVNKRCTWGHAVYGAQDNIKYNIKYTTTRPSHGVHSICSLSGARHIIIDYVTDVLPLGRRFPPHCTWPCHAQGYVGLWWGGGV